MTQTLRDLMEADDAEPDQHVRETFVITDADGQDVEIDIVGHYDGPAHQQPESTTIRVWDPMTTQPFEERPYDEMQLLHQEKITDYSRVPMVVNGLLDTIQDGGIEYLETNDD